MAIRAGVYGFSLFLISGLCHRSFVAGFSPPCIGSFGPDCKYTCRCTFWDQCDPQDGHCAEDCMQGYAGNACQYVDVAHESSVEADFEVIQDALSQVVDGKDDTCILEDGHANKPLSVNLDEKGSWVQSVQVLLNPDAIKKGENVASMNDLQVHVYSTDNNTLEISQSSLAKPSDVHFTFHLPKPTFVLKVQIQAMSNKSLSLCEINVLGGRDLASKKPTSQGETANPTDKGDQAIPVDENFPKDKFCPNSFDIKYSGEKSFWSVALGQNLLIWRLKIETKQNGESDELFGLVVNVTLQNGSEIEVYKNEKTSGAMTDISLTQNVPATNVTLWNREQGKILEICDIQVIGDCVHGYYGWECEKECHCNDEAEDCDKMWGYCPLSGCHPGYTGNECLKCPAGKYGLHCADLCSPTCLNNTCDHVTGQCMDGCISGWDGDYCTVILTSTRMDESANSTPVVVTTALPSSSLCQREFYWTACQTFLALIFVLLL